jgi:hypothetical protein
MVGAASESISGILTLHPPCGPFSDAAVASDRGPAIGPTNSFALHMGGTSEEMSSCHNGYQQQHHRGIPSNFRPRNAEHATLQTVHSGSSTHTFCEPPTCQSDDGSRAVPSSKGNLASEEGSQSGRNSHLSSDASQDRPVHQATRRAARNTSLYRHSMGNIPNPSMCFPATGQQIRAAVTALRQPLQVVTRENSLIR